MMKYVSLLAVLYRTCAVRILDGLVALSSVFVVALHAWLWCLKKGAEFRTAKGPAQRWYVDLRSYKS